MSTDRPAASGHPQDDDPRMTRRFDEAERRPRRRDLLDDNEFRASERQDEGHARVYEETPRLRQKQERPESRRRAPDERIRELILALGDPNHPEHAQAVSELVAIGPAAVPSLGGALSPDRPWLTAYRAAET